jgi:phage terminase small subunit
MEVVMVKSDVVECLLNNCRIKLPVATMYADAFMEYRNAQSQIDEHGPVVRCERTGATVDNPFIKTRDSSYKKLLELGAKFDASAVWEL